MASNLLLTVLVACTYVTVRANYYPSAPQYTRTSQNAMAPTRASQKYQKGQVTAPGYNSATGFWGPMSSKGDNWSFNQPASSYARDIYKNDRADKLSGPSAYGSLQTTEGRVSGKAMAAGGYSRFTSNYQDPRYGSFTLPPRSPQDNGRYASYRNTGYYGPKGPSIPNYQHTGHSPVNIQPLRGSRIYENPGGVKHNQTKKTGVYVIPTPSKLYYDGVKN